MSNLQALLAAKQSAATAESADSSMPDQTLSAPSVLPTFRDAGLRRLILPDGSVLRPDNKGVFTPTDKEQVLSLAYFAAKGLVEPVTK